MLFHQLRPPPPPKKVVNGSDKSNVTVYIISPINAFVFLCYGPGQSGRLSSIQLSSEWERYELG